jgi:parallel beta-helix repeat protein
MAKEVCMKFRIGSVIACVSLLVSFTNAGELLEAASIIQVPVDQPTIQSAITAASNGDTVQVAPGTYVENLNFSGKAITVTSAQGPAVTIIDGNQAGSVVAFASGEGPQSVLNGFTMRNGSASGISIGNASPTITGNTIINNSAANGGGGISINGGSPLIQGNLIKNNGQTTGYSGGVGGGGIAIVGATSAQILNNNISNNSWSSSSGGGIALFAAGTPTIENNVVSFNTAYSQGGGFYIVNQSDAAIVQNLIVGNSAGTGGGLYWLVPSGGRGPFLINNTIYGNPSPQGSGVFADGFDGQIQVTNNIIMAATGQTAVICSGTYTSIAPTFLTNDVVAASGVLFGGICGNQTGLNGNISADPLFVNASGGDFHLQRGSPAIDAGTNANTMPQRDFDGVTRPLDGNGDGIAIIDMGIYEAPVPDLIPPVTTASATPAPGAAGWNTTNVLVTLTATDNTGGSGVQSIRYSLSGAQVSSVVVAGNPVTVTITAEGTTSLSYAASDVSGNVEATKSLTINIDKTPPVTVAAATPASNAAGWNSSNVTVTLNATDSGSGVQSIRYWLNGAQGNPVVVNGNSANVTITAEGTTSLSYAASDVAGNVETTKSLTINIDKTAPATVAAAMPAPNASGWNSSNVNVMLNATDSGSGVQSIRYWLNGAQGNPVVVNGNSANVAITAEGTTTVGYAAVDAAGNVEPAKSVTMKIDKTAPVISGLPASGCTIAGPKNQLIQVASVVASDALSGVTSLNVTASSNPAGAPGDILINSGQVLVRAVRGRVYTVAATAGDAAGNTSTASSSCTVTK